MLHFLVNQKKSSTNSVSQYVCYSIYLYRIRGSYFLRIYFSPLDTTDLSRELYSPVNFTRNLQLTLVSSLFTRSVHLPCRFSFLGLRSFPYLVNLLSPSETHRSSYLSTVNYQPVLPSLRLTLVTPVR